MVPAEQAGQRHRRPDALELEPLQLEPLELVDQLDQVSLARGPERTARSGIAWRAVTPLSSYRRTGADLPFGDPRRAHGTRFEGYYWRLTDVAAGRVAIVLCGVCRDAAGPWAIVALATHPDGLVRSRIEPLAEVSFSGSASGPGRRSPPRRSICASTSAPTLGSTCALRNGGGGAGVFGGIGPAQIVPGLPQYWHPHLLGGRVVGLGVGRRVVVYAEKNWGPRFTEHWWWGQAQGFPGADACVAFAGGRVLGGAPTSVVVRVEDRVLRLAPPFARVITAVGETGWRVRARSARWTVELEGAAAGSPAVLPVPVPGSAAWRTARSSTWRGRCACACGGGGGCGGAGSLACRTRAVDLGSRRTAAG